MRTLTLLAATVLASVALAGCAQEDEMTPTPTPTPTATPTPDATPTPTEATPTPTATPTAGFGPDTYALTATGVPAQVETGKAFNFTLYVNGTLNATSDHIGAHYANNTTAAPSASAMKACEHQAGALPGVFTVTCNVTEPGTWHVYGHARYNDSGTLVNWWSAPQAVQVRNFTIETAGFPTSPQTHNQTFTFTMFLNGTETVATDHIGAHFWNATQSAPTTAGAGSCEHQTGNTTGVYTVTCKIAHPGAGNPLTATPQVFYVRAHMRLTDGGVALNWWGPEQTLTVLAV